MYNSEIITQDKFMNKLLITSTLLVSILFSGCSKATAFDFFSTDAYYEKAISNMKKASLMKDKETKALLSVVYLNPVDPKTYNGCEYFYVAVHILDDNKDPKKRGLNNKDYKLTMIEKTVSYEYITNGAEKKKTTIVNLEPMEIKELAEVDKLLDSMPVRSKWNLFYLVKFKEINAATLTLFFENDLYGKVQLKFREGM